MTFLALLGPVIQFIGPIFLRWIKRNEEAEQKRKEKNNEAIRLTTKALEERDASSLTAGFDTVNRM